jgi:hypothetical protein
VEEYMMEENKLCAICKNETLGVHNCLIWGHHVHAICGKVAEENKGYGEQLTTWGYTYIFIYT